MTMALWALLSNVLDLSLKGVGYLPEIFPSPPPAEGQSTAQALPAAALRRQHRDLRAAGDPAAHAARLRGRHPVPERARRALGDPQQGPRAGRGRRGERDAGVDRAALRQEQLRHRGLAPRPLADRRLPARRRADARDLHRRRGDQRRRALRVRRVRDPVGPARRVHRVAHDAGRAVEGVAGAAGVRRRRPGGGAVAARRRAVALRAGGAGAARRRPRRRQLLPRVPAQADPARPHLRPLRRPARAHRRAGLRPDRDRRAQPGLRDQRRDAALAARRLGASADAADAGAGPLFERLGGDVRLLTAGCPLRQLYAARFPTLYRWVLRKDGVFCGPRAEDIGVRQWLNAFTSGDYVGRWLWSRDGPNDDLLGHPLARSPAARSARPRLGLRRVRADPAGRQRARRRGRGRDLPRRRRAHPLLRARPAGGGLADRLPARAAATPSPARRAKARATAWPEAASPPPRLGTPSTSTHQAATMPATIDEVRGQRAAPTNTTARQRR